MTCVAGAVDLHAGAVELRLENRCAAEAFERFGDTGRGLGQHRADRAADPQGELRPAPPSPPVSAGGGDRGQVAAEHRRATHRRGRDVRGLGHRVGHHAGQRALAQLAAEQAPQERLLDLGCRGEQTRRPARRACACEPLPDDRADLAEAWRRRRATVSDWAPRRAAGIERSAAQPTPIWRCGSSPDSQDTTIGDQLRVGLGPAWRSSSAIRAILARRAEDAPTSTEAVATSISSTTHLYTPGRQRHASPR